LCKLYRGKNFFIMSLQHKLKVIKNVGKLIEKEKKVMAETYELVVISEKEIVRKIGSEEEKYTLSEAPNPNLSLVKESKKSILQTIQLDELFENLDNCVSLLDITYNAVNGSGMSSSVTELKDKFSDTLDESLAVMQGFETGTKLSVEDFIKSYKFLTEPVYKLGKINGIQMAVKTLSGIKDRAGKMEKNASSLAAQFDDIEKIAQVITRKIMDERDMDVQKRNEALAKLNVLNEKVKALKEVKECLDDEVSEYGEQYNKLSVQIAQNEKRSYALSMVSAVMGGLSTMFGGGQVQTAQPADAASSADKEVTGSQTEQKYIESQNKIKELESKSSALEKELISIKEQIASEKDTEKKAELSDKQDQLTIDKKQVDEEIQAAKGQADVYKNASAGISNGLRKTSEELSKMADKMDAKNITQYDRLDNIAKRKSEVQKERRNTIVQLAQMTSEIENTTTESRDLDICISALITAVGCMRIVKVYLSDIALFWKNVAKFCNGLVERISELNEDVGNFAELEDYCEIFKQETFVNAFLLNIVSWTALNNVSEEYLNAFSETRKKYQKLESAGEVSPKEHWVRAKESAKELNGKLAKEIAKQA